MKKAVFIGNCQCSGIREVLKHTNFNEKYTSLQYANWEMIAKNEAPPSKALSEADLVIYQPLSDVHGCFSTNKQNPNNMLAVCKPDATIVSFPRIHNNSLWPIFKKARDKRDYYGDDFIRYYADKGIRTRHEFLELYDAGQLDFRSKERFDRNMAITLERESDTDIKVHDFITQNIGSKYLFLTHDHPTTPVFHHCVEQLLEYLDDVEFHPSFSIDTSNDNIIGLQDSVYHSASCRYPDSSYTRKELGIVGTTSVDDIFYRNVLFSYCKERGI